MPLSAFFSRHAVQRIVERLSMDLDEVSVFLDEGVAVDVGREPASNRRHMLFYSPADRDYFVAIQDALYGTIVTILPIEYHRRLAWPIQEKDMLLAMSRGEQGSARRSNAHEQPKSVFRIGALYIGSEGKQKVANLFSCPASRFGGRLDSVLRDPAILLEAASVAAKKNILPTHISVRFGNTGIPIFMELDERRHERQVDL